MAITAAAKEYHERMFPGYRSTFLDTDPEFIERFDNFAFDEVVNSDDLDGRTRMTAILASLVGCQGIDEYRAILPAALNFGVTPTEAKEMLYQAAAYLGIGRLYPFLRAANEILAERGVRLPLPGQSTTAAEERLAAGERAQIEIFGDGMKDFWRSGPEDSRHINRWLTDNCFGDWYARGGLDLRRREMLTFCFLAAQGGCERQLASHIAANIRLGSGKEFLIKVISQCIPFIGYPRALNALDCINKISE
ncbi:carboxymuconolactone decarboxylase family protein [Cloacibacillus evryensis]|uniref:carboxymuconolactone decarboxylase family protein n=1 Tax=Cloacibacillus evryensis TaxID=508460 RepID=UPI00370D1D33